MTRDVPRRPKSSRAPTSRPRKLAGQGSAPPEVSTVADPTVADPTVADPTVAEVPGALAPGLEASAAEAPAGPEAIPAETHDETQTKPGLADLFDSPRVTRVLVVLVVVLAVAAGGLFAWDHYRGDEEPSRPSKQPVAISADDATAAVDAAAKSAETILTRTYEDYDKQIDDATALMTDAYAKQFRATANEVEDGFVAAKTDQQARVVAQGVVHATRTEVQALLFMNYYVSKDGSDTTYTPYRVLVTVLHTDRGWLVSAIDTK